MAKLAIPTAIKELAGNPGKRPLNRREPKPRSRIPKPPAHLSDAERVEWRRILRITAPMGVITEAEADILALYVASYAQWVECRREIEAKGILVVSEKGAVMRNPVLKVADDAQRTMLRCMGELGLTPSARVRMVAPESAGDAFEKFLNDL